MSNPTQIKRLTEGLSLQIVIIEVASTFHELEKWFNRERACRKYNYNDFRHIEGHPNYFYYFRNGQKIGKSPLLGGLGGQKRAEEILQTAIGDSKEHSYLINWDFENERYMRFEDENFKNQYHGYHLVKPKTHERDTEEENRISKRVIDILNYRSKKS